MTKPVIKLIDDAPTHEVVMAKAMEHHVRTGEFGRLCNEGHVRVLNTEDVATITCQIEDEEFTEARVTFPSTQLMARLQLAVAAGQSCRNLPLDNYDHAGDAMRYGYGRQTIPGSRRDFVWRGDYSASDAVAQGYSNTSKITATVKRPKGARP